MEKAEKVDRTLEKRELTLILLDCFAVNLSALGALLLRFELSIGTLAESGFVQAYLKTAPLYSLAAIALFMLCRLYRSLWQYASIDERAISSSHPAPQRRRRSASARSWAFICRAACPS